VAERPVALPPINLGGAPSEDEAHSPRCQIGLTFDEEEAGRLSAEDKTQPHPRAEQKRLARVGLLASQRAWSVAAGDRRSPLGINPR
jgi:hypothetical protein